MATCDRARWKHSTKPCQNSAVNQRADSKPGLQGSLVPRHLVLVLDVQMSTDWVHRLRVIASGHAVGHVYASRRFCPADPTAANSSLMMCALVRSGAVLSAFHNREA